MKTTRLLAAILAICTASVAMAQNEQLPPPPDMPPPEMPDMPPGAPDMPPPILESGPAAPAPAKPSPTASATPAAGLKVPELPQPQVSTPATTPSPKNEIRLNFQGTALSDVLSYLSEAAGFVIVTQVPVSGTVNVVSKQPVSADEAVDLLNAVLAEKGYTAIRNGRILKIVNRSNALTDGDLPVKIGGDDRQIPHNDEIVTQILPVKYLDAEKLIDNLRPLLSANATINANANSNAILMTDTQTNIHRIALIIRALDNNISGISTIRIFGLHYADAKALSTTITQLFATDASSSRQGNQGGGAPAGFGGFGGFGGGRGGGGGNNQQPQSEARKAAARVVAVSDEQSNSVIVSAPEEYMAAIADIVNRLDTNITEVTETRIFRLEHADSTELASELALLYPDTTSSSNQSNRGGGGVGGGGGRFGGFGGFGGGGAQQTQSQSSERATLQARVVAVPDPRTNSVIVTASRETMEQIALNIGRLDASDAKKQHVYIYKLSNADPENVATVLRSMFGDTTSSSTSSQDRLNQRATTGASADAINGGIGNSSGSSSGSRTGRTGQ